MSQTATRSQANADLAVPPADAIPSIPATWYLLCRSNELKDKPLSKTILGRRLAAFRGANGRVAVMDAHCSHLGADLGRGEVKGDSVECPFHHWRFSQEGRCVSAPPAGRPARSVDQRAYPAEERHGYVYFFFGSRPLFALPFFPNCDPNDFAASRSFSFAMDSPWFMLVGNGFDGQHFQAVHERRLLSPPQADCPAEFARRMKFDAEVAGDSVFDRLLRRFVGKGVRVSITSWGGPYVLVEGEFGRAHSRLLVASQPVDEANTFSHVIAFARRSGSRLFDRASLRIRRRFTQAFLQHDIDKLSGVRYRPAGLSDEDAELIEFFRWVATLPRSDYEEPAT